MFAIDVDTAAERPLNLAGYGDGVADVSPAFTPDGRSLIVNRVAPDQSVARFIVRTDGSGAPVVLSPPPGTNPYETPERLFSPDGSRVVVRYPGSNEVWIYDAATGGAGQRIDGVTAEGLSWQRR